MENEESMKNNTEEKTEVKTNERSRRSTKVKNEVTIVNKQLMNVDNINEAMNDLKTFEVRRKAYVELFNKINIILEKL